MTRLDVYVSKSLKSRAKAQDMIKEGRVSVNGKIIKKSSFQVNDEDQIDIEMEENQYVSRGAYKLETIFENFATNIENQIVLDIGASTGGFTQVCLNHGAKKVYALDVGHLQLDTEIESNPKVIKMEGFNAKEIKSDTFADSIDFICMDVSFISCRTILEVLFKELDFKHMAVLIKPQFECGPKYLNKQGVLTNEKIRSQIVIDIERYVLKYFRQVKSIPSPIKGRNGNQEYILYATQKR